VETYVRIPSAKVIPNWRQVHMLISKVWAEDDGDSFEEAELVSALSEISIEGKERFERDMAVRQKLWDARSPFEPFLLKCLKEKTTLDPSRAVLGLFFNDSAAVSAFAIAEAFNCSVRNVDVCLRNYDYNLAQANAIGDQRLRFRLVPGVAIGDGDHWQCVSRQRFDVVVACLLADSVPDFNGALKMLADKLKPGGRILLLERSSQSVDKFLESYEAKSNGFNGRVETQDVTSEVKAILNNAVTQMKQVTELQGLRQEYETWSKASADWLVVSIQFQ